MGDGGFLARKNFFLAGLLVQEFFLLGVQPFVGFFFFFGKLASYLLAIKLIVSDAIEAHLKNDCPRLHGALLVVLCSRGI